jgi:hypothetical protein
LTAMASCFDILGDIDRIDQQSERQTHHSSHYRFGSGIFETVKICCQKRRGGEGENIPIVAVDFVLESTQKAVHMHDCRHRF